MLSQNTARYENIVNGIRQHYSHIEGTIPLHVPVFRGNEKQYLNDTIDSTFVSSVGAYVNEVERKLAEITGAKYAIATGNGTLALHAALVLAGVTYGTEAITQSLSFVATGNSILYCGAVPVFVDVDKDTGGLSPDSLNRFLQEFGEKTADGQCRNKKTGRIIQACVPMHTFGLVCRIEAIAALCQEWNITLIEDSAESIGSYAHGKHSGRFGALGVLSFNGNKTITCGGGGAILTDREDIAKHAKHITTTAKVPHAWEFFHDEVGYNYRLPNLNAALLLAQLEQLNTFLEDKAETAAYYTQLFSDLQVDMMKPLPNTIANHWLNALLMRDRDDRDAFLKYSNDHGLMTRPAWTLMEKMPAFANCFVFENTNAQWLEDRIVNIPSGVR
jgi:aminotransferase in exopolysaccharide biosynthesis